MNNVRPTCITCARLEEAYKLAMHNAFRVEDELEAATVKVNELRAAHERAVRERAVAALAVTTHRAEAHRDVPDEPLPGA